MVPCRGSLEFITRGHALALGVLAWCRAHQHCQDGAGDAYNGYLPDFMGQPPRPPACAGMPAEMAEEDDRGPFDSAGVAAAAGESRTGADVRPMTIR